MSKPKSQSTAVRSSQVASTVDNDSVTGARALGMTTGAAGFGRGNKGIAQTAFNSYLIANQASREEVKNINDTIMSLIEKTRDKQEDIGEKFGGAKYLSELEMIAQLKKVEIKFHEMVERRKIFGFFDSNSLKMHE